MTNDDFGGDGIPRKNMVLFYLIDTSGSMYGAKINIVNNVMSEVVEDLIDVGGADSDIKVAVMTFSDRCEWMYSEPKSVEEFEWDEIDADGWTAMGEAFSELNKKLSRNTFLQTPHQSFAPVIFLLSDGEPTDDYQKGLKELKSNKWYKYSMKIAMAIGNDANDDILAEFTGNKELVVHANNGKALKKLIKFISIASSQINSCSRTVDPDDDVKNDDDAIKQKENEIATQIATAVDPSDNNDDDW